ncbi:MAG: NfeD family protein [Oscillospiraceae bacterium]|nr:NfeD family protein [Oscillospiraceae bacterium]
MYQAALFWLVLMIFFIIVEANTVTLLSIWFAAGSLVAIVAALLGAQIWLQALLFFAVSAILLACLRPMFRKYVKPKVVATNVDAIIGSQGYVTAAIDNLEAKGQVKLGAMEWTARSTTGEKIPEKTLVKVDKIEGVKAFVTPVKVKEVK